MREYRFECAAEARNIQLIDDMIERILLIHDVSNPRHVGFAAHELVINTVEAVIRNVTDQADAIMRLRLQIDDSDLRLSVNDRAGGLTAEEQYRLEHEEEMPVSFEESGRGIYLVRQLTETLTYHEEADGSYTYTMTVKR